MTGFLKLGFSSLWSRRFTVVLVLVTIAISAALLLGVERVRHGARESFTNTISGVDLLVGARSGTIPLLLYSVFRIGNATNNITWQSYQEIAGRPGVRWTIPLSLGDSHRGYRVLGTNRDYFEYYRVGRDRRLDFSQGREFRDLFDVVIGAEVARTLGYTTGDRIVVAHGLGKTSFAQHDDMPFVVSGVLAPTGTPVDRTVHVSLEAIEAIHVGWEHGVRIPGSTVSADVVRARELRPGAITAFMLGLENRIGVFRLQRFINEYRAEPLLAVLPGVALQELWGLMSVAERALQIIALFVVVAAFAGMVAVSLAGLNERRREIAVYRAVGAGRRHVSLLILTESLIITALGLVLGICLLFGGLWLLQPALESRFGLYLGLTMISGRELLILAGLLLAGIVAAIVPVAVAYRNSLSDGLTARV